MKNKVASFIVIVLIILGISGFLIYKTLYGNDNLPKVVVKVTNEIKGWDYTLDDRDTELMKNEFTTFSDNLKSNNVNYEEYAKSLAKLYTIDLYTINNKVNIYDIPCLEYVHPSIKDNFRTNIKNTIYMYLQDNSDGTRNQKLPIVTDVSITDFKPSTFKIGDKEYESFNVSVHITYKEDLDYDEDINLDIIRDTKKLYVVKQTINEKDSSSSN